MRKTLSLLAVAALVAGLGLTLATPTTLGGWTKGTSYTPPATKSARFEQSAVAASVTPALHVGDTDLNPATSTPGLNVSLTSDRINGNLDIYSFDAFLMKNTSDSSATASTSDNRLFTDSLVDVTTSTSSTDCSTGIQTPAAWTFGTNAVGNLAASNNYSTTRGYTAVTGGNTAPAGSKLVCPRVTSKFNTGTYTGRRDLVLASAGRNVGLRVKAGFRSPSAATWRSAFTGSFPVLKYTVTAPPVTNPASRPICRNSGAFNAYGDLGFGWPTALEDDSQQWTGTHSIYRFVIMRQNPSTGVWAEFKRSNNQSGSTTYTAGGSGATGINSAKYRYYAGINSDHINNNDGGWFATGAWVGFMWRGYLYSGDTTRYINSDFVTYAREKGDAWQCGDGNGKPTVPNTETGGNSPGVHGIS